MVRYILLVPDCNSSAISEETGFCWLNHLPFSFKTLTETRVGKRAGAAAKGEMDGTSP